MEVLLVKATGEKYINIADLSLKVMELKKNGTTTSELELLNKMQDSLARDWAKSPNLSTSCVTVENEKSIVPDDRL